MLVALLDVADADRDLEADEFGEDDDPGGTDLDSGETGDCGVCAA